MSHLIRLKKPLAPLVIFLKQYETEKTQDIGQRGTNARGLLIKNGGDDERMGPVKNGADWRGSRYKVEESERWLRGDGHAGED